MAISFSNLKNSIKACENKLIDDVEKWMEFHKARNTTSHVYEVEVADEVYRIAFEYLEYAKDVLKDWNRLSDEFKEIISEGYEVIYEK